MRLRGRGGTDEASHLDQGVRPALSRRPILEVGCADVIRVLRQQLGLGRA
ncbi:MAG: hypothetical protein M3P04_11365 [Actinomycetota bacterium]|nr:hypothetical protein [Actinomycetota bacterium]